ncbi:MAG: 4Fe-4S binding protein [Treponema sp.]|nr:4Fe-4S binding protein [Treponema sp.]
MKILFWFLVILLIFALGLLLLFVFNVLIPSVKEQTENDSDSVFSELELNYVFPKEKQAPQSDKRAFVMCSPDKQIVNAFLQFNPGQSCLLTNEVFHSGNKCAFACIGLGDCVKVCPQEAIFIKNNTAVVSNLCTGCGLCVSACPKGIIKMIDGDAKTYYRCSNHEPDLAGCKSGKKEETVLRSDKKDFKIWSQCYKIVKRFIKN